MNLSPADLEAAQKTADPVQRRIKALHIELELLIMQSQSLRNLSVEIMNFIGKSPDLTNADFAYWSRKADEYFSQAGGFDSLKNLRLEEMTILTDNLIEDLKKFGIEVNRDNLDSTIQTLESSNN